MRWEKIGRTVYGNGGSDVTYGLDGYPDIEVQSRKRPVPHANGNGYWYATSYFVMAAGKDAKECRKLAEAKAEAEKLAESEKGEKR